MKIIFLDIDGVLNSHQSAYFWHNSRSEEIHDAEWELYKAFGGTLKKFLTKELDPIAISNLERILREVPKVKIVVSSTWRLGETTKSLKFMFSEFPLISKAIIGKTSTSPTRVRGHEIADWLDDTKREVVKFVIIDDDSDMGRLLPALVKTDSKVGLDWHKAQEVIDRLKD